MRLFWCTRAFLHFHFLVHKTRATAALSELPVIKLLVSSMHAKRLFCFITRESHCISTCRRCNSTWRVCQSSRVIKKWHVLPLELISRALSQIKRVPANENHPHKQTGILGSSRVRVILPSLYGIITPRHVFPCFSMSGKWQVLPCGPYIACSPLTCTHVRITISLRKRKNDFAYSHVRVVVHPPQVLLPPLHVFSLVLVPCWRKNTKVAN